MMAAAGAPAARHEFERIILFLDRLPDDAPATTGRSWTNFHFFQHVKKMRGRANPLFGIVPRGSKIRYNGCAVRNSGRAVPNERE